MFLIQEKPITTRSGEKPGGKRDMKRKVLALLLTVVLLLSGIPLAIDAENTGKGGNGNQYDANGALVADSAWYQDGAAELYVWDESDLLAFGTKLGAAGNGKSCFDGVVIHIMADLDMHEISGLAWKLLIKRNRIFQGIIDGHNHTISHFSWAGESGNTGNTYAGLLGGTLAAGSQVNPAYGASAGVFNLALTGAVVTSYASWCGGLFGSVRGEDVRLENLYVDITLSSTATYLGGLIGQIPGTVNSDIQIRNCVVRGSMATTVGNNSYTGGLIGGYSGVNKAESGEYQNALSIENCAFYGTVRSTHETAHGKVGGLIGCVDKTADTTQTVMAVISDCLVAGEIAFENATVVYNAGKVIGVGTSNTKTTIRNMVTSVKSTGQTNLKNWNGNTVSATYVYGAADLQGLAVQTLLEDISSNVSETPVALTGWTATTLGYPLPRPLVMFGLAPVVGVDVADDATVFCGYQTRTRANADRFDFRLISTLTLPADTLVSGVGYRLAANFDGKTLVRDFCTGTVYTAVSGEDSTGLVRYTAEELGGDYLFGITVTDAPVLTDEQIVLEVTPYYVNSLGKTVFGATRRISVIAPQLELNG